MEGEEIAKIIGPDSGLLAGSTIQKALRSPGHRRPRVINVDGINSLPDGPLIAMLYSVVHRLGDLRKSAREVALRGSSVLTQDFRGPQMGCHSGGLLRLNSCA